MSNSRSTPALRAQRRSPFRNSTDSFQARGIHPIGESYQVLPRWKVNNVGFSIECRHTSAFSRYLPRLKYTNCVGVGSLHRSPRSPSGFSEGKIGDKGRWGKEREEGVKGEGEEEGNRRSPTNFRSKSTPTSISNWLWWICSGFCVILCTRVSEKTRMPWNSVFQSHAKPVGVI